MNHFDPDYFPQSDVSRRAVLGCRSHWECLHERGPLAATRCYGIFGSGDKASVSQEADAVASDEANSQGGIGNKNLADQAADFTLSTAVQGDGQGGVNNRNIGDSAVDQSQGQGTIAIEGGLSQGGYASRNLAAGAIDLNSSSGNTITVGSSPADVRALVSEFTGALNSQNGANTEALGKVLNNLTPLAESKQTDGASKSNKNVLYVSLAALALLGYVATRD